MKEPLTRESALIHDPSTRHASRASMRPRPADLPDYDNPPVVEVALSIQFTPLIDFRTVHAGPLWDVFRRDFPKIREQPPLEPVFETFGPRRAPPRLSVEVLPGPLIPRLWFLNKDESELIQFQADRFVHNWRMMGEGRKYPHYESVKERFITEAKQLSGFLESHGLGEIAPNQCEVTYINHIKSVEGEDLRSALATALRVWKDPVPNGDLGPIEDARLLARFAISSADQKPIGRLTVTAEPARHRDGIPMIILTLTARGQPDQSTLDGAIRFLDLGRDKIVRGFTALTTEEMHRRWRRKQ